MANSKADSKDGNMGTKTVNVPDFGTNRLSVMVIGAEGSELITHAWSQKAIQQIKENQERTVTRAGGREARNPEAEFEASFYLTEEGLPAIKAGAFKAAMASACKTKGLVAGITGTQIKKGLRIIEGLVPVYGSEPYMRTDMVRLKDGTANPRYRPAFKEWAVEFTIEYLPTVLSLEQVAYILSVAGFSVGVFEMRPERCETESHGCFRIADKDEMAVWRKRKIKSRAGNLDKALKKRTTKRKAA